jgi:hypothetical protein
MCTLYTLSDLIILSTKISNGIYTYSLLERNGTTDKNNPKKKNLSSSIYDFSVKNIPINLEIDKERKKKLPASFHRYPHR